jgi:hypothetical protein
MHRLTLAAAAIIVDAALAEARRHDLRPCAWPCSTLAPIWSPSSARTRPA